MVQPIDLPNRPDPFRFTDIPEPTRFTGIPEALQLAGVPKTAGAAQVPAPSPPTSGDGGGGGDGGAVTPYSEYSAYFANDFLDVGDISGLVGGKSALTLSFWLKIVSVYHGGFIGNNAAWSTGYRGAIGYWAGNIDVGYWDDSGSKLAFAHTTTHNFNDWHHFALVQDGTSFVAYRNGSSVASATVSATTSTSLWNNFAIGRERSQFFTGYIDDVAIIDGALDATQVGALQTSGLPQDPGSTLGHWRMGDDANDSPTDGASITSIQDSSGNGNHATQSTTSSQPTFSTDVPT